MNRDVAISKALSKLLRHAAEDEGLKLDAEGFANVEQVVSPTIKRPMMKDITSMVVTWLKPITEF
jgi:RNA:NAD 2'-phosphotransferase (TPT1/KptA family)